MPWTNTWCFSPNNSSVRVDKHQTDSSRKIISIHTAEALVQTWRKPSPIRIALFSRWILNGPSQLNFYCCSQQAGALLHRFFPWSQKLRRKKFFVVRRIKNLIYFLSSTFNVLLNFILERCSLSIPTQVSCAAFQYPHSKALSQTLFPLSSLSPMPFNEISVFQNASHRKILKFLNWPSQLEENLFEKRFRFSGKFSMFSRNINDEVDVDGVHFKRRPLAFSVLRKSCRAEILTLMCEKLVKKRSIENKTRVLNKINKKLIS